MKIRTGDKIKIISGKDLGREAVVEKVFPQSFSILAKDINLATKHLKKSKENPEGARIKIARPVNVSNVALVCPKCNKITRVGYKIVAGKKTRSCKKCGEIV